MLPRDEEHTQDMLTCSVWVCQAASESRPAAVTAKNRTARSDSGRRSSAVLRSEASPETHRSCWLSVVRRSPPTLCLFRTRRTVDNTYAVSCRHAHSAVLCVPNRMVFESGSGAVESKVRLIITIVTELRRHLRCLRACGRGRPAAAARTAAAGPRARLRRRRVARRAVSAAGPPASTYRHL